jgi:BTB/POZ domain
VKSFSSDEMAGFSLGWRSFEALARLVTPNIATALRHPGRYDLRGYEKKLYAAHRDILTVGYPFFYDCSKYLFKEAKEDEITLSDVKTGMLELLLAWLYSHSISVSWIEAQNEVNGLENALYDRYMIAGRLCMEGLQNSITDELRRHPQGSWLDPEMLEFMRGNDNQLDALESYLLEQIEHDFWTEDQGFSSGRSNNLIRVGRKIAFQLVLRLCRFQNRKGPFESSAFREGFHYHIHAAEIARV